MLVPLDKNRHPDLMKDENGFRRYSRQFNIDLAPKLLFSKSASVDSLIESGVSNYLEFNNVADNYFYNPTPGKSLEELKNSVPNDMVKIPFSKSEIFTNTVLSFKEKRQLVKAIEMCLEGTDKMDKEEEGSKKSINSTH